MLFGEREKGSRRVRDEKPDLVPGSLRDWIAEQDESQSLLPSRWASQNQYGPNPEEGSRNDQENLELSKVGLTDGARSISGSFSGTIKYVRVLKQVK